MDGGVPGTPPKTRNRLLREEERENAETFGKRHSDDGLDEDLAGGGRIAADRFSGLEADQTDADGGAEETKRTGNIALQFSEEGDHGWLFLFCGWKTAVRTRGTLPAEKRINGVPRPRRACHHGRGHRPHGCRAAQYRPTSGG